MKKHGIWKTLLIIVLVLLLIGAIAAAVLIMMEKGGKSQLRADQSKPDMSAESSDSDAIAAAKERLENTGKAHEDAVLPEADAYHNGKAYRYRTELTNILFLGVDKESNQTGKHQADAIYLAVFDEEAQIVDLIAISRNTYAAMDVYDIDGKLYTTANLQLCLAYGYGNDDKHSAELTEKAVSGVLYGLPIHGYYTIFMDEIPQIVNAIGGVTMTVDSDMAELFPNMKEGSEVTLTGRNALRFLRERDDTNAVRVRNQLTFLKSLAHCLKDKVQSDPTFGLSLYKQLSDISVTDISTDEAIYLLTAVSGASLGTVHNLEGTSGILNGTEVVYLDNQSLYEFILSEFYEEIN